MTALKQVLLGRPRLSPRKRRVALAAPIFGSIALTGWFLGSQYLVANSYSTSSKMVHVLILAPIWEESLKLAVAASLGLLPLMSEDLLQRWPGLGWRGARLLERLAVGFAFAGFLWTAVFSFALPEVAGGGLDGVTLEGFSAAVHVLSHMEFSVLAVPVILEARRRVAFFVTLGWGLHSLTNAAVIGLSGRAESIAYASLIGGMLAFDVFILLRWYGRGAHHAL